MGRLRKKTDACVDCSTPIAPNKTSRCRKCAYAHVATKPEFQAARRDGIRAKFRDDPAHLAKMQNVARRNGQKAGVDPEHRAWLVANGKRLYAEILSRPDIRARNVAAIRANSHKITEHWLGWCPAELRAEYRRLTLSKRMLAADARAAIEAIMADRAAVRRGADLDAIFWLNRWAPTRKLDDGTYRYGNSILRAGELIEMAKVKGWKPAFDELLSVDHAIHSVKEHSGNGQEERLIA